MERWINYMTDHSSEPGHSTNWECWKHLRGRDQSSCCTHPWQQGWTLFPIRVWQNHSATRGEDEYRSLAEHRKGKTQRWKRVQSTLDGSREGEGCGVSERAHFLPHDSWADRGVDRMARDGKHFRAPEKEGGNKSHHPEGHKEPWSQVLLPIHREGSHLFLASVSSTPFILEQAEKPGVSWTFSHSAGCESLLQWERHQLHDDWGPWSIPEW